MIGGAAFLLVTGVLLAVLGAINLRPDPFASSIPPLELMFDRFTRRASSAPRVKWHKRPARQRGWGALVLGGALLAAGLVLLVLALTAEQIA